MKNFALMAVLLMAVASAEAATSSLPFIDDDYAKALNGAKERHLPLFVEVSAPW